jgi:hypothetical protein
MDAQTVVVASRGGQRGQPHCPSPLTQEQKRPWLPNHSVLDKSKVGFSLSLHCIGYGLLCYLVVKDTQRSASYNGTI